MSYRTRSAKQYPIAAGLDCSFSYLRVRARGRTVQNVLCRHGKVSTSWRKPVGRLACEVLFVLFPRLLRLPVGAIKTGFLLMHQAKLVPQGPNAQLQAHREQFTERGACHMPRTYPIDLFHIYITPLLHHLGARFTRFISRLLDYRQLAQHT